MDKGITFANLKHTLFQFAREMFGEETRVRFRCDYFPFVEPGVDMSIEYRGDWLEILGAGMVHPNVLRAVGYDPDVYSGFAFGHGPGTYRHAEIRDQRRPALPRQRHPLPASVPLTPQSGSVSV